MSMRMVHGYACRNCADEELAKRGVDPAKPKRAVAGNEAYVSATDAARNRGLPSPSEQAKNAELGVNRAASDGRPDGGGSRLDLYA